VEQGIRTASSVGLLIRVFDFAIAACAAKDSGKVSKALTVLEQGLDPHAFPELARSLSAIYRYCRTLLEKQAFGEVAHFLVALRDTFTKVKAGNLSTRKEG
jgi:flagellin-specific chaperone FliS